MNGKSPANCERKTQVLQAIAPKAQDLQWVQIPRILAKNEENSKTWVGGGRCPLPLMSRWHSLLVTLKVTCIIRHVCDTSAFGKRSSVGLFLLLWESREDLPGKICLGRFASEDLPRKICLGRFATNSPPMMEFEIGVFSRSKPYVANNLSVVYNSCKCGSDAKIKDPSLA